ncbi:MAG: LamG domain-containing protein, partial [Candidatus Gracilibacteria bacterium]
DSTIYTTYSTNASQTKMQAMSFLEDGGNIIAYESFQPLQSTALRGASSLALLPEGEGNKSVFSLLSLPLGESWSEGYLVPEAFASSTSDYSKRFPSTQGDSLGILLGNSGGSLNQPVQEMYNASSFTGVDVVNTNSGYTAVFGKNNSVSGTGVILKKVEIINFLTSLDKLSFNMSDILNDSLVGYWDMSTLATDGKLKDLSGNRNDGTMNGTTSSIGRTGGARNFNGTNDYINISDSDNFYFTGNFSMSVWINPNRANNSFEGIIHQGETNANMDVNSLEIGPNNQMRWLIRNASTSVIDFYSPVNSVSLNTWQYIVVKKEGGVFSMFLNGIMVNSQTNLLPLSNIPYNLWIGARNIGGVSPMYSQGKIDEVRIYNRALSDSEIFSLYNATK